MIADYKGKQIPDEVVKGAQLNQENVKWINELKEQGYNIIDIGADNSGKQSTFYNMEHSTVYGA